MILHQFFYALPEISLLCGIVHLYFLWLLSYDSARFYARASRFWLLLSLFFTVVFYDRSFNPQYFENNAYTLLFNLLGGFFAYVMLRLASSWFASENRTGCKYYVLILTALIGMNLLLSSVNLIALLFCYTLLIFINYRLLGISYEKLPSEAATRYMGVSAIILVLFAAGFSYLNNSLGGNVDYTALKNFFADNTASFPFFMAAVAVIVPFLYSLGIAPFHMIAEDKAGKGILPVSHYFAMVAPVAFWGAFMKLNLTVFAPYASELAPVYVAFALLSVVFGAIGANARINLHRIYAYSSMYHFALILLLLSFFKPAAAFAAFLYLFMYMLGLNSVYVVFYGLKSYGEYLSAVASLSGLAQTRPYTTGALLVSLFSLIGLPPLAGFAGQLNLANEMLRNESYASLGVVFFFLLILAKAYLEIIKTAYFEQKLKVYDTENKSVLFYTLFGILCIAVVAFNPGHLFQTLQDMFYVVFL